MPHNTTARLNCESDDETLTSTCGRVATHTVTIPPTPGWGRSAWSLPPMDVAVCESHRDDFLDGIAGLAVCL